MDYMWITVIQWFGMKVNLVFSVFEPWYRRYYIYLDYWRSSSRIEVIYSKYMPLMCAADSNGKYLLRVPWLRRNPFIKIRENFRNYFLYLIWKIKCMQNWHMEFLAISSWSTDLLNKLKFCHFVIWYFRLKV